MRKAETRVCGKVVMKVETRVCQMVANSVDELDD